MAFNMPAPIAWPMSQYDSALCHQWYPWLTGPPPVCWKSRQNDRVSSETQCVMVGCRVLLQAPNCASMIPTRRTFFWPCQDPPPP